MRRILAVFVVVLATSCTTLPPDHVAEPTKIKSVLVISSVRDRVNLGYTGLTVFNNSFESAPVDWGLRQRALDSAVASLNGQFDTRTTTLSSELLDRIFETQFDALPQTLQAILTPGMADIVVVVGTSKVGGAFVSRRGLAPHAVGLAYIIGVFDGANFNRIARGFSGREGSREADIGFRGQPYEELSPAAKELIHSTALATLSASMPAALRRLGLLN